MNCVYKPRSSDSHSLSSVLNLGIFLFGSEVVMATA